MLKEIKNLMEEKAESRIPNKIPGYCRFLIQCFMQVGRKIFRKNNYTFFW